MGIMIPVPREDTSQNSEATGLSDWTESAAQELHPELAALVDRACQLLPSPLNLPSTVGLLQALRDAAEIQADPLRKQHLVNLLNDFQTWFMVPSREDPRLNDGQVILKISADGFQASLSITPPRADGRMPTLNRILLVLEKAGVKHGIDLRVVNQALETVREKNDLVLDVTVAKGEPPLAGKPMRMEFLVPFIDKNALRQKLSVLPEQLAKLKEPVKEGTIIGQLRKSEVGVSGRDVFGKVYPPPDIHARAQEYSETLQLDGEQLMALAPGYVVVDGNRVDIEPLYIVENPAPKSFADFSFDGGVIVRGHLQGPGNLHCEDLFVLGNCEQINVSALGDIFISGGVIGHRQSNIETDGSLYASFVSEANISALGEVTITNAIINSRVISTDCVRVVSNKGMITGGSIQALKEISACTIGSEFGMLTETIVGKDFLTVNRLAGIMEKMKLHEDNLRRIADLKNQMARARVRIEKLPPDKQEIYIGVLRKESNSQAELRNLTRRKDKLSRTLSDFLTASIRVLDSIFPPVRVQIVNEITEITKQLNDVTLQYDKDIGIVSSYGEKRKEGPS
jgi:uncharacterized protein (DUF342 family)